MIISIAIITIVTITGNKVIKKNSNKYSDYNTYWEGGENGTRLYFMLPLQWYRIPCSIHGIKEGTGQTKRDGRTGTKEDSY